MAYETKHGYWIHKTVKDSSSVTGTFILAECACSRCGYVVRSELKKCPGCKAVMDQPRQ